MKVNVSESECVIIRRGYIVTSDNVVDDTDSETELQFQLSEHIDQLLDRKCVLYIGDYINILVISFSSRTRSAALKYLNELMKRKIVAHLLFGR